MCGINGFISSRLDPSQSHEAIEKMNAALIHRGPDASGMSEGSVGGFHFAFGQRRLAIVDLSPAGVQPMYYSQELGASNEVFSPEKRGDSRYTIVFNGEIYNHLDLRKELEEEGYVFSTHSDTEVVLAGYDKWGEDIVNKLNGMWAFCLFDRERGEFFCSRDRFGKKPFYYFLTDSDFIFSSELKGILAHDDLDIQKKENILPEAIDFYLTTGYIPAPMTIYKNVMKLEAGHNLFLSIEDGILKSRKKKYYELPDFCPENDRKSLVEQGKSLLDDAVKIRMFSADVPVGAFLSGGLDSSSVVAVMTKYVEKSKLHTFSIGFEGKYDETPYIEEVKDAFGTSHHHAYFRETDFQSMIDTLAYHYDEPFGDYSSFPTTFVSKLAREHVTVSLSGDGGDEIFGGYMMHQVAAQMDVLYRLPFFLRKTLSKIIPSTKNNLSFLSRLKEAFRVSTFPKEDFYAELGSSTLYRPDVYRSWTRDALRHLLEKNKGDFIQSVIDFDLLYNTIPDNFLVKVDRASMSQSLEVRSPFLDYRFAEFARRIPTKWKVSLTKTKILMRDIIADIVPPMIVNRGKQGFEPPIGEWICKDDSFYSDLQKMVHDLSPLLDSRWISFFSSSTFGRKNKLNTIFFIRIFLLQVWVEKNLPHS